MKDNDSITVVKLKPHVDHDRIQPPDQLQRLRCQGGAPFFECVSFPAASGTPSSCSTLRHPGRVDLVPYHEGIVLGHINDVMEDDTGPADQHPPAAVSSIHLVQIVHISFIVVVVQDDGWLPVLTITDFSCFVQCDLEDHILVPLKKIKN
ncbi:Hypothetical predicted protein [Scomber scombrus]|uniref:Uncharacterized protein n=1 Tax=Scomber scombrus TaxID=13677 RepID=A0AAV1NHH7_SCOSC